MYLVQRELDIAWSKYASWDVSSPIEVTPEDLGSVRRDFGADAVLVSNWETYLTGPWSGMRAVDAYITATDSGYFPLVTRIGHAEVKKNWMDIDIRAARDLGLKPGDEVGFAVGPDTTASLRVRDIYAVELETGPVVVAPSAFIFAEATESANEDFTTLNEVFVIDRTVPQVESVLSQPFYRERLIAGGYYSDNVDVKTLGVESREERLAQAEEYSSTNLSLIAAISLLSAFALVGIILRELVVFTGSVTRTVSTLHRLGASWSRLWMSAAGFAFSASVLGLAGGATTAVIAFANGLTGSTFPPTLTLTFVAANAGLLLVCGIGVICSILLAQRKGAVA